MMPLLRFLLFVIFSVATVFINTFSPTLAQQHQQLPNIEIEALMSFKSNLEDPLGALNGWDSSTPAAPCDWRGIQCSATGSVFELRLPHIRLSGSITDRIADLRELRKLSLRSNLLNGTIPESISALSRLRAVFLQSNELSGSLPLQIANLTGLQVLNLAQNSLSGGVAGLPPNLRYLDLSSNDFSGSIPGNLSSSPGLEFINLSFNRFSGQIPASLGNLQHLQYLWLDWNLLEGTLPSLTANCTSLLHLSMQGNALRGVLPAAIGYLPNLQVLSLSHNNLSGSVPSSVFGNALLGNHIPLLRIIQLGFNSFSELDSPERVPLLSSLQVLDLQENGIQGDFPSWVLSNALNLTVLNLSGNFLRGSLPVEIGHLSMLREVRLARNVMGGEIPSEIVKCSYLQVFDLEANHFSGDIPSYLSELRFLRHLSLGGNIFSGNIPPSFGNLSKLEVLSLDGNLLSGNVPEELERMSNITLLNLSDNNFSGEMSGRIGNLRGLQVLNLSRNGFSGRIPSTIGNLLRLRLLDLSGQNLSGELPMELSGLPNLQVLVLSDNFLSGNVPEGFSSLLSLQHLNLTSNGFSGVIPATYGFLQYLEVLSVSVNNVSGVIPAELGNCSNLKVLQLHTNHLGGQIPADLSGLSHLQDLDLSRNSLTGEIPPEISNCTLLTSLRFQRNHLSGVIPNWLSELSNLTVLDLSANNFSGSIPDSLARLAGLRYLNLSQNNLEGEIPAMLGSRFNNPSVFAMNPYLCGNPLVRACANGNVNGAGVKKSKKRLGMILLISVVAGVACMLAFCCCCGCILGVLRWQKPLRSGGGGEKKRSPARASSGTGDMSGGENGGPKLVMFNNKITYAETVEATRQFDEENVLSRGRHGVVFKACFPDGTVLSIRRLPDNGRQVIEERAFRKEAESLGKVKHRNLTVLRGYYAGPPPEVRLLVYDYMPNGNLATLLQEASHQDGHVLNWPMRHLIALGVARGLAFLHAESMVHGDVKPQNVLFDADFEAHLSDFGLDRLMGLASASAAVAATSDAEASTSATMAPVVGSVGYVSPEAALSGQATKESDVYSFGIVLLELLTGRRPVMFSRASQTAAAIRAGEGDQGDNDDVDEDIVKWVKRQLQRGQISELLEPGLLELDPESSEWEEFLLGVKVGLLCTAPDPLDRPSMADIVFMLEGCRVGPDIPSSADPTSYPSPTA